MGAGLNGAFCSDQCRWDVWAIRRLTQRLNVLSDLEVLKVIREAQSELLWLTMAAQEVSI